MAPPTDVLTLKEFAAAVRIGLKKAGEMVRAGEVRAAKVNGRHWRIPATEVGRVLTGEPLEDPNTTRLARPRRGRVA